MSEIRRIITDQINRHVAMTDTHRSWLADDIATRCEAITEKEKAACADIDTQFLRDWNNPETRAAILDAYKSGVWRGK